MWGSPQKMYKWALITDNYWSVLITDTENYRWVRLRWNPNRARLSVRLHSLLPPCSVVPRRSLLLPWMSDSAFILHRCVT
jgi:hypothetical protein